MQPDQTHQTSQELGLAHIAQWRASGLTRGAYCAQHGIKVESLAYWVKCANRKARAAQTAAAPAAAAFAPARLRPKAQEPDGALLLQCPNGSTLRLPPGTSASWLGTLLSHLS